MLYFDDHISLQFQRELTPPYQSIAFPDILKSFKDFSQTWVIWINEPYRWGWRVRLLQKYQELQRRHLQNCIKTLSFHKVTKVWADPFIHSRDKQPHYHLPNQWRSVQCCLCQRSAWRGAMWNHVNIMFLSTSLKPPPIEGESEWLRCDLLLLVRTTYWPYSTSDIETEAQQTNWPQ